MADILQTTVSSKTDSYSPLVAAFPAKTLWSILIKHWSDTFVLDRCLIDINPCVFAIRVVVFNIVLCWTMFWWHLTMYINRVSWWRHQMETFSAWLAIFARNSPVTGEFTAQRPLTPSFDVFFDLRLNKRLSKQSWCWWFGTASRPLWRHCNGDVFGYLVVYKHDECFSQQLKSKQVTCCRS